MKMAGSAVTRNTFILLLRAIERIGLPLTAAGNVSGLRWPRCAGLINGRLHYRQADAFRLNEVIDEPDFLPLHVVPHPRPGSNSRATRSARATTWRRPWGNRC